MLLEINVSSESHQRLGLCFDKICMQPPTCWASAVEPHKTLSGSSLGFGKMQHNNMQSLFGGLRGIFRESHELPQFIFVEIPTYFHFFSVENE